MPFDLKYSGALEKGMIFRHKHFDIHCQIAEVRDFTVTTISLDCEKNPSANSHMVRIDSFVKNWNRIVYSDRYEPSA